MKKWFSCYFLLFSLVMAAQVKDRNLPRGNEAFGEKNYSEAEADYRISQSKVPTRATSSYNLGNAIYRQNQPGEAKFAYMKAIENAKGKKQKYKAMHNLGNVFMLEKNYSGAVEAYKDALRNNPYDEETRYNYALAKQKLKENPPKNNNKDKNKDKNKDQQDQKDKDKDKDKGDNKKDQNKDKGQDKKDDKGDPKDKNGDKGDKDKQNAQPKPSGASKQRMENMLDALNNEEKKIQDKVKAREVKGSPVKNEKDW
ncbi:tetratricopeptide repeat protein [Flavobacterium sp. CAU 1735]|uniref:tetratricopeptide repeat protein n=1 Tax=Flavobacterium sp. CAU 1735 TaxID=3140361 RepID=UPI00326088C1